MDGYNCRQFAKWCKETNDRKKERRIRKVFEKMRDKYAKANGGYSCGINWEEIYLSEMNYAFENEYNKE